MTNPWYYCSMDMKTIRIDSSTIIRTILFLVLAYLFYQVIDLFLVVLTGIVIATAIEPAIRFLQKNGFPRLPAVISLYLFGAGALFSMVYFLVPPLIDDLSSILSQAPDYIRSLQLESTFLSEQLGDSASVGDIVSNLRDTAVESIQDAVSLVSSFFGGVISFFLIVTLSFYFSVREGAIEQFIRLVTPTNREEYVTNLWHRSQEKIGRWLQGQLILILIVGLLSYLGLTIIGVPNALLLSIIAGLFELIPVFGPILAAVPAIGLAAISGGVSLALLTAGLYIIIQQFENNLIHPLVVTKVVGVPPIIVILAVVIGGSLAGFLGILLAVPFAAVLVEFAHDVDDVKHSRRQEQLSADNSV